MRCDLCREAVSARIDDEAPPASEAEVYAHLATCADCRGFVARTEALHRHLRVRPAEAVPDRSAELLAAVAPHAPRAEGPGATERGHELPERGWARYALLWVALTQLALAVPALLLGSDHGADLHVAHEIGSWDAALAFAMLMIAFQPRRAAGLVPFVGALTAVLLSTSAVDIIGGHTPAFGECAHLLTLLGVALLWLVSRSRPDDRPLLRWRIGAVG
jgi:predicted anti-sigma-YlaC factor YlaD